MACHDQRAIATLPRHVYVHVDVQVYVHVQVSHASSGSVLSQLVCSRDRKAAALPIGLGATRPFRPFMISLEQKKGKGKGQGHNLEQKQRMESLVSNDVLKLGLSTVVGKQASTAIDVPNDVMQKRVVPAFDLCARLRRRGGTR